MFYVYALWDPRTNQPFYVGKGCGSRASVHLNPSRKHENPRKWAKIVAIQNAGLEVEIRKLQENLTQDQALDLEEELIVKYGRLDLDEGGILTNRRKRGVARQEGWQPYKRAKKPRSAPAWNKGLTKDDPRVAKNGRSISKAKKGCSFTDEHRQKIAEALIKRKESRPVG